MNPGEAWTDGYVSGWNEAAAWCAGRAAATDGAARAAYWDAYLELTKQADAAKTALAEADRSTT